MIDLFNRIGRDHDGNITRAEMIKTVRAHADARQVLGLPSIIGENQRAQLEEVYQGLDADDSRTIEFDEFVQFMEGRTELPHGTPRTRSPGRNGERAGPSPATEQQQHDRYVRDLFGRMTCNHGGSVRFLELVKGAHADAKAREILGFPRMLDEESRAVVGA